MAAVNSRHLLVRNKTLGDDPRVNSAISEPDGIEGKLYLTCRGLYLSPLKKSYVEACLMTGEPLTKISEILEIPEATLEGYSYYFFNVVGFDKLSMLEVVDESKTDDEKTMKIWAMSQGLEFIGWRLGKAVSLSPVEGLQELFTQCVYKSKEALFSGNASESSKEATKWTKLSMDMARILKVWVMDGNAAKRDIEFALKSLSPNFDSFSGLVQDGKDGFDALPDNLNGDIKIDNGDDIGDLTQLDK